MTSTEVFESITNGGASDFAAVVTILSKHGLWCLIGGLAVNCYVEPVYTMDADMVVVSTSLPNIQNELSAAGFQVTEHEHSVNAQMRGSELRIQFTTDPRYQDFVADTETKTVLGRKVRVASLANVVRGKVWARNDPKRRLSKRKKDELDLIRIAERFPELWQLMPPEIVSQVRDGN
jgi:hypothetical protein